MDWVLVRGMRVIRISDVPEHVHPAHEPDGDEERQEAREARRRRDATLRSEFEALDRLAERLSPGVIVEAPVTRSAEPAPAPRSAPARARARNPVAAAQAQAFVEAARDGTPLCES